MKPHRRVLIVVTRSPSRGPRFATSEWPGLPPRDVALAAARLMRGGDEVRVMDQDTERLSDRSVRREARWWRADIALLWAGGSLAAEDLVPDERPVADLLGDWPASTKAFAAGPLASRYGEELLDRLPRLAGAISGEAGLNDPLEAAPGVLLRGAVTLPAAKPAAAVAAVAVGSWRAGADDVLPAWQVLPLEACGARAPGGIRHGEVHCGRGDAAEALARVRHAVHRAGARRIVFSDRDLLADPERARRIARGMLAAAPGRPWACRVAAGSVEPALAVALLNSGCDEVLVTSSAPPDAPGLPPMDDPQRPRLEAAVEAFRGVGVSAAVEHVVGRPGHDPDVLSGWQRWFADRRIVVRPRVRVLHAGDRGPRDPTLAEARERAGCWDNALRPRDVVRGVRSLSARLAPAGAHA